MWPFRSKLPEPFEGLEERVRKLELENAERQLAVLNAVEKLAVQFNARIRARERAQVAEVKDEAVESTTPQALPYRSRRSF